MCVLQNSVIPRLRSWVCRVVLNEEDAIDRNAGEPSLAKEAAAGAKTAAAAAEVAKTSQEMLIMKMEVGFA